MGTYQRAVQTYWVARPGRGRLLIHGDSDNLTGMPAGKWTRLGELLLARRVALGYKTRSAFAAAKGFSHTRTISDMENAKRDNYEKGTFAQMEQAYEWTAGSIRRVLDGGEPTELETTLGINVRSELPGPPSALRLEVHLVVDDLPEQRLRDALRILIAMLGDEG